MAGRSLEEMLWSRRRAVSVVRDNQRQTYRQSIELPIALGVDGLPAPVYGTLINLSENGCKIRSLILIDRERGIEFQLTRVGESALKLHGKVVSRAGPPSGGG